MIRRRLAAPLLLLLLLLLLTALAALVAPHPALAVGWATVVDDQFETGGVPTHWHLYDGPYGSGAHNCAVPAHVSVENGAMVMLMGYETSGRCGAGWYTAGMMIDSTYAGVDQAVEVRWRVVRPNAAVRSHFIIPMRWPVPDPWYQGESDYCEGGSSLATCSTYLHYGSPTAQISHSYTGLNLTQWTTMRFEHRDHVVQAYINGSLTWTYTGTETTVPSVSRRTVLQQECSGSGCPSSAYAGTTERIEIDYVKIENPA